MNTPQNTNEYQENDSSKNRRSFFYSVLSFLKFVAIVFVIVVPIRMYVAQPFIVRGESMQPTFENSDYLIIDEFTYRFLREAERGEVIIFRYPRDPKTFFIKRIIGVPGDTVRIRDGKVSVTNGSDVFPDPLTDFVDANQQDGTWMLEENEYFVLGDNRDFSSDSRVWGTLPENLIIGRALLRLWPLGDIGVLPGI
ncbi:MAG: signal peptidase I [bacterium]|nr:signal peptidase I [bacterium]